MNLDWVGVKLLILTKNPQNTLNHRDRSRAFMKALDLRNCSSFLLLALVLPSLPPSPLAPLYVCQHSLIVRLAAALNLTFPLYLRRHRRNFPSWGSFSSAEWGGGTNAGLWTVAVGRGFSQCRFHAEKWGICHHLEVDSDNGTATATTTMGDFSENGKKEEMGEVRGSRLAKTRETNGSRERTKKKAVLTREVGHALTEWELSERAPFT